MTAKYQVLLIRQTPIWCEELCESLHELECIAWRDVEWSEPFTTVFVTAMADLIVILVNPDAMEAQHLLHWFRSNPTSIPKLAVVPPGPSSSLLAEVTALTDDFLLSPIRREEFRQRLTRLLGTISTQERQSDEQLVRMLKMNQLVGRAPAFLRAIEPLPRIAESGLPVVITGETGTGKELCARAIHHLGPRRNGPFIAVDCTAIPDHLFENELFGHARGAYTDAHSEHKGLVAIADGGTLFLDEIDALSPAAQAKFLRFLQERVFRPLGSDRFVRADVNVLAASNQALEVCIRKKAFREDLYYRLSVLQLHVPPLRERRDDIELLANHFLEYFRLARQVRKRLVPSALTKLGRYQWPGNVRELSNVIQRAIWLSTRTDIHPHDIELPDPATPFREDSRPFREAREDVIRTFERSYVEEILRKHNGNVTRAATEAGTERRAFGRLIKKYNIPRMSA